MNSMKPTFTRSSGNNPRSYEVTNRQDQSIVEIPCGNDVLDGKKETSILSQEKSEVPMDKESVTCGPSLEDRIQRKYRNSVHKTSLKSNDSTSAIKNEITRSSVSLEDHIQKNEKKSLNRTSLKLKDSTSFITTTPMKVEKTISSISLEGRIEKKYRSSLEETSFRSKDSTSVITKNVMNKDSRSSASVSDRIQRKLDQNMSISERDTSNLENANRLSVDPKNESNIYSLEHRIQNKMKSSATSKKLNNSRPTVNSTLMKTVLNTSASVRYDRYLVEEPSTEFNPSKQSECRSLSLEDRIQMKLDNTADIGSLSERSVRTDDNLTLSTKSIDKKYMAKSTDGFIQKRKDWAVTSTNFESHSNHREYDNAQSFANRLQRKLSQEDRIDIISDKNYDSGSLASEWTEQTLDNSACVTSSIGKTSRKKEYESTEGTDQIQKYPIVISTTNESRPKCEESDVKQSFVDRLQRKLSQENEGSFSIGCDLSSTHSVHVSKGACHTIIHSNQTFDKQIQEKIFDEVHDKSEMLGDNLIHDNDKLTKRNARSGCVQGDSILIDSADETGDAGLTDLSRDEFQKIKQHVAMIDPSAANTLNSISFIENSTNKKVGHLNIVVSDSGSALQTPNYQERYVKRITYQQPMSITPLVAEVFDGPGEGGNSIDVITNAFTVDEIKELEEIESREEWMKKVIFVGAVLVLIVTMSITIALRRFVFTTTKEWITMHPSFAPTLIQNVPSLSPSNEPSSFRFTMLKAQISEISDPDTFMVEGTPQNKALRWLAYEDTTPLDASNLVQRYVLAVFYYATNGDDWTLCSKDSGCACIETLTEHKACRKIDRTRHVPQLSQGTECNWFNYDCLDDWIIKMDFGTIRGNGLEGTIPSELKHLDKLQKIDFSNNALRGTIPDDMFGNMKNLSVLSMNANKFSGTIPKSLLNCASLRLLDLSRNKFSGTLSTKLGMLNQLRTLYLYSNDLSGSPPSEIFNLTSLERIVVRHNQFSGSIPKALLRMPSLRTIDVTYNKLNGTIPRDFNLPKMKNFSIAHNHIEGEIPFDLYGLENLEVLDLADNKLSGTLSPALAILPLKYLTLYGNNFNGGVPESLCLKIEKQRAMTIKCSGNNECEPGCCHCIFF